MTSTKAELNIKEVKDKLFKEVYETALKSELLTVDIEKADILIDEISQDFFDKYDSDKKSDLDYIRYYFDRYRLKTDILIDYFYEIEKTATKIEEKLTYILDALREPEESNNNTFETDEKLKETIAQYEKEGKIE